MNTATETDDADWLDRAIGKLADAVSNAVTATVKAHGHDGRVHMDEVEAHGALSEALNRFEREMRAAVPIRTLDIVINNDDPHQIYLLKQYARTLQSRVACQRQELARLNTALTQPCGEVWIDATGAVHYTPRHDINCGTRFRVYGKPA